MGLNPSRPQGEAVAPQQALTESEVNLLVANTHFTAEQINKFHHDFLQDCPTGRLEKKDFVRLFTQLHPSESKSARADAYCDYVFRAFDQDGNGHIDFSEFVIAFSITSFGDLREKAKFAFHIFDLGLFDLNGVPSEDRSGDNAPERHVDLLMARLDKNNDNFLSLDEFVEGVEGDEGVRKFLVDSIFK